MTLAGNARRRPIRRRMQCLARCAVRLGSGAESLGNAPKRAENRDRAAARHGGTHETYARAQVIGREAPGGRATAARRRIGGEPSRAGAQTLADRALGMARTGRLRRPPDRLIAGARDLRRISELTICHDGDRAELSNVCLGNGDDAGPMVRCSGFLPRNAARSIGGGKARRLDRATVLVPACRGAGALRVPSRHPRSRVRVHPLRPGHRWRRRFSPAPPPKFFADLARIRPVPLSTAPAIGQNRRAPPAPGARVAGGS
jgi:hypothetical protein